MPVLGLLLGRGLAHTLGARSTLVGARSLPTASWALVQRAPDPQVDLFQPGPQRLVADHDDVPALTVTAVG